MTQPCLASMKCCYNALYSIWKFSTFVFSYRCMQNHVLVTKAFSELFSYNLFPSFIQNTISQTFLHLEQSCLPFINNIHGSYHSYFYTQTAGRDVTLVTECEAA